jgi:transcriptional regulator with XRE-family HTH domain
MDIGGLLRVLRQAARVKQSQLAARAGISQNYLSMIENGRRQPSAKTLERLGSALNVPLPFLVMYRSGTPENLGDREKELIARLKELCLDFLKLKLGVESKSDAEPESAEHREA